MGYIILCALCLIGALSCPVFTLAVVLYYNDHKVLAFVVFLISMYKADD